MDTDEKQGANTGSKRQVQQEAVLARRLRK
jgi:hypothetical protein